MITDFPSNPVLNIAGESGFYFSPYQDIIQLPPVANMLVTIPPIFKTAGRFLTGSSVKGQLNFDEQSETSDNGPIYSWSIAGFYPGEKLAVGLFAEMEQSRHLVVVKDWQGDLRIVGIGAPLTFTANFQSGKIPGDAKGYNILFTGRSPNRAPVYKP